MRTMHFAKLGMALAAALVAGTIAPPPSEAHFDSAWYRSAINCQYRTVDGPVWEIELQGLAVKPPRLRALGSSPQRVGWRFIVETDDRHLPDADTHAAVIWTHQSSIRRATAYPDKRANFSWRRITFEPPPWSMPGYSHEYFYRAWIEVFWYLDDNTVERSDKVFVYEYLLKVDGEGRWHSQQGCDGRQGHVVYG